MKYSIFFFYFIFTFSLQGQILDSTFGIPSTYYTGTTSCDFEERDDRSYDMLILDDNKIILAGHSSDEDDCNFAFVRLHPDGHFDQTAGPDGEVQLDLGFQHDSCLAAIRYMDNQMLMGGGVALPGQTGYTNIIVRTDFDGNLDTSFGNEGIQLVELPSDIEMITHLATLPNGNIIIAGNVYYGNSLDFPDSTAIFISRLLADGSIDDSFGNNGTIYQRLPNCETTLLGEIKLYPDGKILITGGGYCPYPEIYNECPAHIYAARYLPDGQVDSSFGENGITLLQNTQGRGNALHIYEDGRILLGGFTTDFLISQPYLTLVARFLPNGMLDSTFNDNGYFRQYLSGLVGDGTEPMGIAIIDENILLNYGANPFSASSLVFGAFCLNEEGLMNEEFGEDGIFSTDGIYPWAGYHVKKMKISEDKRKMYFYGYYQQAAPVNDNMLICRIDISDFTVSTQDKEIPITPISVYPNPISSGNLLKVSTLDTELYTSMPASIWNSDGVLVFKDVLSGSELWSGIPTSSFSPGIYFLELISENKRYTQKFVVSE